jgi:hypothetical protein
MGELFHILILLTVVAIFTLALWVSVVTFFEVFGEEKDDDDLK